MPGSKRPADTRSTEDILREMEELSKSIESTASELSVGAPSQSSSAGGKSGGGALKSLLGFFVSVDPAEGDVETRAPEAHAPAVSASVSAAATPKPRVADLVAGEEKPQFSPPPPTDANQNLSEKSFEEIYREAGITESACSADELAKLLENPAIANQPMNVKIIAVSLALSAKGIGPDVPIADAVRRDRALDAFQAMLSERARQTEERNNEKIEALTKETEEYLKRKQAEIEGLRTEAARISQQALQFAARREAEETRLANLISPFLEGKPSPVTIGNQETKTTLS